MSLWPQRGIRCAFSIQRSVYQSSCVHPSQRNLAQSFRLSVYTFAELSKRFYAGNEGYIEKDDIDLTRRTSEQKKISNKLQQKKKSQDGQFFSPKSDKIIDQEDLQSLLLHCDRAIILSRGSSDSNTLWTAKDHLFQATRIYVNMVKRSSLKSDLDVLSYETYLIRSGYAHVIRTIGALIGIDGVIVCARMMQDLLRWELDLLKMNFESADGSEEWYKKRKEKRLKEERVKRKPLNPNDKELVIIEESVLSSGPFLQDLAPIFYDITNDLTSEIGKGNIYLRKYVNEEYESLATELRLLIRQIPQNAWENPVSRDWYRFRTSNLESFSNSGSVIDASIKMMAQAYAKSTKTLSALQVCLDEMEYFSSPNKHTARLQLLVSQSFRHQVRIVSNFLIDEDDAEVAIVQEKLQELLKTFDRIFTILFYSRGKDSSFIRLSKLHTQEFTTILRSLFNSIRLFEDHKSLHCFEPEQKVKAKQLSLEFRSWLQRCIEFNNQKDQIRLPKNLSIGTFNMILHKFMVSSPLFGEASIGTASKLIDYMLTSDDAPQPDEITLTILIANSARLRDAKVLRSAILAAHLSLRKRFREKNDDKSDHLNSVMYSLLKHAVINNDGARMIALLDAARFALSYPLKNEVPLDVALISSQKVIMLLYPSLQIDRPRYPVRKSRLRKFKAKRRRERKLESIHGNSIALHLTGQKPLNEKTGSDFNLVKESHVAAQFHPSVLIAALHLIAKQGKTGLAERIWRFWLRVIKRQSYEQGGKANYDTVRALTILNRLYALEVKREGKRKARLKAYSAILHGFPSSFGPRIYGRTREHRLVLSLRSKRTVIGWAYEFKRNLNINPQITRNLMARKVTRLRYLQMRQIWLSKRDQLSTIVVEGLNETLPIPISQIVFSDRPDYPFYHTLLSVFRKNGTENLRFDDTLFQQDDSFLNFFKLIEFDMKTFGLEVPLDFHIWISKQDQLSK